MFSLESKLMICSDHFCFSKAWSNAVITHCTFSRCCRGFWCMIERVSSVLQWLPNVLVEKRLKCFRQSKKNVLSIFSIERVCSDQPCWTNIGTMPGCWRIELMLWLLVILQQTQGHQRLNTVPVVPSSMLPLHADWPPRFSNTQPPLYVLTESQLSCE